MSDAKPYDYINNFLQIFADSVNKTLLENLDTDTCKKINFSIDSSSRVSDAESLKEDRVIYQLDYTTGSRQGALVALIPEELIAVVSDLLTGGNGGAEIYKGSLSEIETNSTSKIFDKIFRNFEEDFKRKYDSNLVFSTKPLFLLKEMSEYQIISEDIAFDFQVNNTLTLSEGKDFKIDFLLGLSSIEKLMKDLGLAKSNVSPRKLDLSTVDVSRIADVKINVTAELGRARVPIKYALELIRGSMVALDTVNNSDIRVYANGIEFAHAQVVAVEDNFGLKITKIIPPEERLERI
jgi:flagellar motor switch protein FliN/FliY